ncbi:MAG TPA: HAD family phosphatase [Acidimicrobiia bacterium]|nr:HAD family phosphatase [Acidimicrobiia bacterium]
MSRPIIFDCDGVLVDSEELAWSAWREALAPHGIEILDEEVAFLSGRTEQDAFRHFSGRGDLPPYEEFWPLLADRVRTLFEQYLEAFEDAADTLEVLHAQGRSIAVASSSPRERLDLSLRSTGLDRFFDVVVAGDEVVNGKPAPDIYLAAAAGLGVEPGECVAVEDAPAGISAGKAAGMRVVAVLRGGYAPDQLGEADLIVPRLTPAALM